MGKQVWDVTQAVLHPTYKKTQLLPFAHSRNLTKCCCPTGGMVVLVTLLDACPDASPLVCTTLFRLTVFQDRLPDHEVLLSMQTLTFASS